MVENWLEADDHQADSWVLPKERVEPEEPKSQKDGQEAEAPWRRKKVIGQKSLAGQTYMCAGPSLPGWGIPGRSAGTLDIQLLSCTEVASFGFFWGWFLHVCFRHLGEKIISDARL